MNFPDTLRRDPVLALFSDRLEPKRKDCAPLAGKSTVNRLEHAARDGGGRYHKIGHDPKAAVVPLDGVVGQMVVADPACRFLLPLAPS